MSHIVPLEADSRISVAKLALKHVVAVTCEEVRDPAQDNRIAGWSYYAIVREGVEVHQVLLRPNCFRIHSHAFLWPKVVMPAQNGLTSIFSFATTSAAPDALAERWGHGWLRRFDVQLPDETAALNAQVKPTQPCACAGCIEQRAAGPGNLAGTAKLNVRRLFAGPREHAA